MLSPEARTFARASLAASISILSSLISSTAGSDLTLNEGLIALGFGLAGYATWYGVGAASQNVEPHLGNKGDG